MGTAATTAIQTNVDDKQSDPVMSYKGRAAGFWFLLGLAVVEIIAFWIFYSEKKVLPKEEDYVDSEAISRVQSETKLESIVVEKAVEV